MRRNLATAIRASFILFFSVFFVVLTIIAYIMGPEEINSIVPEYITVREANLLGCVNEDELTYYYYAHNDPNWGENNKFGIYIYAENSNYFELARKLVNSNGGKWGYVLIPYNVKDRDFSKWKRVFEQLHDKKLIPVIQLHDVDPDNYRKHTDNAAFFLNQFLWPIKYKYISVYNEPNSAAFWYGRVDPEEYARILDYTIYSFKKVSDDYFMLNGAFNVTAPTNSKYMDSFQYMTEMDKYMPGIFRKLDGWASHPYPQPNFSGSPKAKGRWSIRAYEDELSYLKDRLGVKKDLPVFITETGWAHAEGIEYNASYYSVNDIAEFFVEAYDKVWLPDDRVRAVMPFTIRYAPPFDHFSWINGDGVPYYHYEVVKSMKKTEGEPPYLKVNTVSITSCE